MDERRKHRRIEDNLVVTFRFPDGLRVETTGVLKDISAGGIQVEIPARVVKGDLVDLDVWILSDVIPLKAQGKVAWVKRGTPPTGEPETGQHIVGIEFCSLEEIQRERLLDYLKSRIRQQPE